MTEFIGLDGEGANDANGKHIYWLFCDSERGVYKNPEGFTLLDFIVLSKKLDLEYPDKRQVFYSGQYDINKMIQRTIEKYPSLLSRVWVELEEPVVTKKGRIIRHDIEHQWAIHRPTVELFDRVFKGEQIQLEYSYFSIRIKYIPGKFISFMYQGMDLKWQNWQVYDIFSFFTSSFVKALENYSIECDMPLIKEGKLRRGESNIGNADDVKYCQAEVIALAKLAAKLDATCEGLGYPITSYHGPGALVKSMMKVHGIHRERKSGNNHKQQHTIELEPEWAREPVACAFTAGHIECYGLGIYRDVYNYDIRSAYPHITRSLPSLKGARYTRSERYHPNCECQIIHCKWSWPEGMAYYPLWVRQQDMMSIQYPARGEGWYWHEEFKAACRWANKNKLRIPTVIETIEMRTGDEKPFAFVEGLYEKRALFKKQGLKCEEHIIKLALNSIYGKTAQQVGGSLEKLPPYFSLVYAGMITAGTRALMTDLVTRHKDESSVIALQTDGIYTTERLTDIPISTKLGEYDEHRYAEFISIGAGIYYTKEYNEEKYQKKGRGMGIYMPSDPACVIDALSRGETSITTQPSEGRELVSFIGMKGLCAQYVDRLRRGITTPPDKWYEAGQWIYRPKECDLKGESKKRLGLSPDQLLYAYTVGGLRTTARKNGNPGCSKPGKGVITLEAPGQYTSAEVDMNDDVVGRSQ